MQKSVHNIDQAIEILKPISFQQISGGITNTVYRLINRDESKILRIYGGSDPNFEIFDRSNEIKNSHMLSEMNIGPKIFDLFDGARTEEFYKGDVLNYFKPSDDIKLFEFVAKNLKQFHQKTKYISSITSDASDPEKLSSIEYIKKFRSVVKKHHGLDEILQQCYPNIDETIENYIHLIKYLHKSLITIDADSVTGCHNDLHHGNIIYDKTDRWLNPDNSSCVKFIDFEYYGSNLALFDISNYFCELSTFDCDWSLYPDFNTRSIFYKAYYQKNLSDDEIEHIDAIIILLTPISHLMWGLWGLIKYGEQKTHPEMANGFDYLNYFKLRIDRYYFLINDLKLDVVNQIQMLIEKMLILQC